MRAYLHVHVGVCPAWNEGMFQCFARGGGGGGAHLSTPCAHSVVPLISPAWIQSSTTVADEDEVGAAFHQGAPALRRSHSFDEVLFDFRSVAPEDIAV